MYHALGGLKSTLQAKILIDAVLWTIAQRKLPTDRHTPKTIVVNGSAWRVSNPVPCIVSMIHSITLGAINLVQY